MAGLTWPILVTDGASGPLGKISVAMDRAAGATDVLGKSLTDLNVREATGVQSAVRHAEAMSAVSKAMAETAGQSTAVQRATLGVISAQDRLTVAQNSGRASAAQLADAQSGLIASQQRLALAQKETVAGASRMVVANREVAASSTGLRSGLAGAVGTAKQLGLVFGTIEIVKKGLEITKQANEFHRAMVQTQTTANVSAAEINKASGALLAMAGPVAAAPAELATAWYHAKSVGLDYAHSIEATRIAAEGAKIGHANLEETMNALTASVASGIPGVKDMGSAMGQLLTIVGSGDMKLSDLNSALGTGLMVTMKNYGLSLTDVGAALATFGDHNIRGASAATQLRMAVMALAVPARGGAKVLAELGLTSEGSAAELAKLGLKTGDLAKDLQTGGLNKALLDLKQHLTDAHIGTKEVGTVLTQVFGKKSGVGLGVLIGDLGRVESKYKILNDAGTSFAAKWKATTQTASFVLSSLGHAAEAAGIKFAAHLGPAIATAAGLIGKALPAAIDVVVTAAQPFLAVFKAVADVLGPVAHWASSAGSSLGPLGPILKDVAAGALALYGAVKLLALGQVVFGALAGGLETLALKAMYAKDAVLGLRTASLGLGASLTLAGGAAAAVVVGLNAFADANRTVAASADNSLKVLGQFSKTGHLTTDMMKTLGVASGHLGSVMENAFHESTLTKIKDFQFGLGKFIHNPFNSATDDAGNFFKAVNGGLKEMLSSGNLSGARNILNKLAKDSGESVSKLESKMPGLKAAFKDATAALVPLTKAQAANAVQAAMLGKSTTATADMVAALGVTYGLSATQAQSYADMVGLTADQINAGQVSTKALASGVREVATAYNTATAAGNDFLSALSTFSKSGGTAADRAALIGATLKANAGDALSYESALNSASSAVTTLGANVKQAAMTAAGASKDSFAINQAYLDGLVATKNETINYLGVQTKLTAGTINYSKTAAGPLLSDLSSIQSAALSAAQAQYQHSRALLGGKGAADAAVTSYVGVENSLVGQLQKLGLTKDAAQALTDKYLGVPSKVRTLIEQQGADPVQKVLTDIDNLLYKIATGHWRPTLSVNDKTGPPLSAAEARLRHLNGLDAVAILTVKVDDQTKGLLASTYASQVPVFHAAGGPIHGPGTGTSDSIPAMLSNGEHVWTADEVAKAGGQGAMYRARAAVKAGLLRFASGGAVSGYSAIASLLAGLGATKAGIAGFLGNTRIESSGSTTAHNVGENAWGWQQWEGGRLDALKNIAAGLGVAITSQAAQLAMIKHELTTGYSSTLNMLRHATSATQAAAYVDAHYEVSSGSSRGARESAAASFYNQLRSGGITTTAGVGSAAAPALVTSTAAIVAALFGKGGTFATRLISSVHDSLKAITETSRSAKASTAAVLPGARTAVNNAIAGALKPNLTQAQQIALLGTTSVKALSAQVSATIAAKNYTTLAANVTKLSAELAKASGDRKRYLAAELTAAKAVAAQAKTAYGALSQAAKDAATAAADAAKTVVASVQSSMDALSQQVSGFTSSIAQGIVGDDSLATLWGNLTGAATTASDALTSAQNDVTTATKAWTDASNAAAGAQAAQEGATAHLTAAQQALAAAQAAVANGQGTPQQYAALTAAQAAQTAALSQLADANSNLASAQSALGQAAGPTADQLNTLTTAQQAYNQAVSGATVTGLQQNIYKLTTSIQDFAGELQLLQSAGANQDLVSQIAGMGVQAGGQLAQQLLAVGPAAIAQLQNSLAVINNIAASSTSQLASGFFGQGASAIDQLAKGLESKFPALKAALAPLIAQIEAMFTFTPTVLSPVNPNLKAKTLPGFANGVKNFGGGLAYVHAGETLVNLAPGTDVNTANQTKRMFDQSGVVNELRALRSEVAGLASAIGSEVATVGADLYVTAGTAAARENIRNGRRRGAR
jgi:hypothetical protein